MKGNACMSSRYVPMFSEIVDSSLWLEEDYICKVFMTMLAKSDRDHVVRGTALAIARWSNKTEAEVLKALEVLSSPDTQRLEPQPFEGRRIERVPEGWLLLNGAKYQAKMIEYNKRVYNANAQRAHRAKKKRPMGAEGAFVKAEAVGGPVASDRVLQEEREKRDSV